MRRVLAVGAAVAALALAPWPVGQARRERGLRAQELALVPEAMAKRQRMALARRVKAAYSRTLRELAKVPAPRRAQTARALRRVMARR